MALLAIIFHLKRADSLALHCTQIAKVNAASAGKKSVNYVPATVCISLDRTRHNINTALEKNERNGNERHCAIS